jgi:hypothetical protein
MSCLDFDSNCLNFTLCCPQLALCCRTFNSCCLNFNSCCPPHKSCCPQLALYCRTFGSCCLGFALCCLPHKSRCLNFKPCCLPHKSRCLSFNLSANNFKPKIIAFIADGITFTAFACLTELLWRSDKGFLLPKTQNSVRIFSGGGGDLFCVFCYLFEQNIIRTRTKQRKFLQYCKFCFLSIFYLFSPRAKNYGS